MRTTISKALLMACACVLLVSAAWGQAPSAEDHVPARLDIAITYNPVLANVTTPTEFGMQGGSLQVQARLWRRFSIVGDVAALHAVNVNKTGVDLDLVTATFGPRYTWTPSRHRIGFFGQALVGEAHALSGLFPSSTGINSTGDSFALQIGGGVNVPLWNHFGIRALDAEWLRTQLPNGTTNVQNNLRLGTGIVYRF